MSIVPILKSWSFNLSANWTYSVFEKACLDLGHCIPNQWAVFSFKFKSFCITDMVGAENPAAYPLERCTMLAAVAAKICKRSNGMLHDENNHIFRHWIKKVLCQCAPDLLDRYILRKHTIPIWMNSFKGEFFLEINSAKKVWQSCQQLLCRVTRNWREK